jgi:N-acyl-D-aspartate/D-glutamate deacylase
MSGRHVIDQHSAEFLQRFSVFAQSLRLRAKSIIGPNQFVTLLQPAIDQQMHSTPTFLSILTTFEHGDLSSLVGHAALHLSQLENQESARQSVIRAT